MHRRKNHHFLLTAFCIGKNVTNFTGTSKDVLLLGGAEEYATSQLRRSSRAKANKFLLAYAILYKRVHFRQYFVCLRESIFNCCNVAYYCQVEVKVRDRIAA